MRPVLTRVLGGVLGVALLGALVAYVDQVNQREAAGWTAPAGGPIAAVPPHLEERCPPADQRLRFSPYGDLPDGAIAVRLCNAPLPRRIRADMGSFAEPGELLTTDVAALAGLVGSTRAVPEGDFCPADGGQPHAYWFLYPDGDARAVRYEPYGCRHTVAGGGFVTTGGEQLQRAFVRALARQRGAETPPGSTRRAGCNPVDAPVSLLPLTRETRWATVTYCPLPDGRRWRAGRLTAGQVERLNRDLARDDQVRRTRCPEDDPSQSSLVGYTVWGDRIAVRGDCFRYARLGDEEWALAPSTVRMLRSVPLGPFRRQCGMRTPGRCGGGPP